MQLDRHVLALATLLLGILGTSLGSGAACSAALSDKKPHDGVAAARSMPIQGIDVSYWQGEVDWREVADAGVRFAYIKATEGGDRLDPMFRDNWRGAKKAGIARGAYHVMYWCRPASEQAAWFATHVPRDSGTLPPVLDVEWTSYSKTCPKHIARKDALAKIRVMLEAMEAHAGRKPIIYTDPKFHHDVLQGEFTDYQFWLRSVAARPSARYGARKWTFWQFTTTGRVPGIAGAVDRNSFNGTSADWRRVLKRLHAGPAADESVRTVSE